MKSQPTRSTGPECSATPAQVGAGSLTYAYNVAEQLTQITGGTTQSFGYDGTGNRCYSVTASATGSCAAPPTGATTYSWDPYGQLAAKTTPASTSAPVTTTTYAYDFAGLRTQSSTNTGTTITHGYDTVSGGKVPLDNQDITTTASGTTTNDYVYGNLLFGGTAPAEQITTAANGTQSASFLLSIPSGVQHVLDSSGNLIEDAQYSNYGIQTIVQGTQVTPFGFEGSYTDATNQIYLVNRYYDPTTDQFLSVDPDLTQTDEPYAFTGDDPLNATDPLGLRWFYVGNEWHFFKGEKYSFLCGGETYTSHCGGPNGGTNEELIAVDHDQSLNPFARRGLVGEAFGSDLPRIDWAAVGRYLEARAAAIVAAQHQAEQDVAQALDAAGHFIDDHKTQIADVVATGVCLTPAGVACAIAAGAAAGLTVFSDLQSHCSVDQTVADGIVATVGFDSTGALARGLKDLSFGYRAIASAGGDARTAVGQAESC